MKNRPRNSSPHLHNLLRGGNARIVHVWKDVRAAVAGTDKNFTTEKLGKAIFLLSIPMVLELVMESVIAGIAVSCVISVPGVLYAPKILSLMGATADVVKVYSSYTSIMLGANIIIMLLFIINAVFRSAGDAAISMRVLWLANCINIVLDPCLIFGWGPFPEMGIKGAAIATNIGRGIAILYQLFILFRGRKRVRITRGHIKIDFGVMKRLIRLSFGGIGQSLIATSSWIGMVRIISL